MSLFRLKNVSLISQIKRIWIRFTCVSLFHYKISFLFFRFFSLIFASNFSLRFIWVIFVSKRNKAKRNSSLIFHFFSLIFAFFAIFSFFRFFRFFHFFSFFSSFFHFFSLNFRFASIFSLNFCLFYLRFRFSFLVFRIEVNHVKSGFFFASISNFVSEAKVRAHPSLKLILSSIFLDSISKQQKQLKTILVLVSLQDV